MNKQYKIISTKRYELSLVKDKYDMYTIVYRNKALNVTNNSEKISSYEIASYLFDVKAREIFGDRKLKVANAG